MAIISWSHDNHLLVLNDTTRPLKTTEVTSNIGAGSLKAEVDIRDTYSCPNTCPRSTSSLTTSASR